MSLDIICWPMSQLIPDQCLQKHYIGAAPRVFAIAIQCCCCRCDEAIVDLEAAQHVYIALGQQAKGLTLQDDIAKIKQLQASMNKQHKA